MGDDGFGGGSGAFEGGEVEFDRDDVDFGVGVGGFDVCDQRVCAGWVAGTKVDRGW